MTQEVVAQTHAMLDEIAACSSVVKRSRLVERFHAQHMSLYKMLARRGFRKSGMRNRHDLDDLAQEVAIIAAGLVDEWPVFRESGYNWAAVLSRRSTAKARDLAVSGETTGLSGASTVAKRHGKLMTTRSRMEQEHGKPPSDEEVVNEWNSEARRRYGDPSRSGLIASVKDMNWTAPISHGPERLWSDVGPVDVHEDSMLSPDESRMFVAQVVTECGKIDRVLGEIAQARFGAWADSEQPSAAVVARRLGLRYEQVRRGVNSIRDVAQKILRDDYGVAATVT